MGRRATGPVASSLHGGRGPIDGDGTRLRRAGGSRVVAAGRECVERSESLVTLVTVGPAALGDVRPPAVGRQWTPVDPSGTPVGRQWDPSGTSVRPQ